jgi:tight adherence protein B
MAFLLFGPPGAVVAVLVLGALPRLLRRRRLRREAEAMQEGLAEAVAGIAAALRAGLSLSQAFRLAASECDPPLSTALGEVISREDLGVPLDVSIDRWVHSARSDDVRLVAGVLRLRIGGGLPKVLDEVRRALRHRRSARREVRSLTAQARLSGTILGVLPIGFFLFLSLTSRHDMAAAYGTPAGVAAIAVGLVLQAGAFVWIRHLVGVDAP